MACTKCNYPMFFGDQEDHRVLWCTNPAGCEKKRIHPQFQKKVEGKSFGKKPTPEASRVDTPRKGPVGSAIAAIEGNQASSSNELAGSASKGRGKSASEMLKQLSCQPKTPTDDADADVAPGGPIVRSKNPYIRPVPKGSAGRVPSKSRSPVRSEQSQAHQDHSDHSIVDSRRPWEERLSLIHI